MRVPSSCLVYTPPDVAKAMVRLLGIGPNERWLEPCVGKGALLTALSQAGIRREQIRGIDLNPKPEAADTLAMVSRGTEFLDWAMSTGERFDKVIANPPYLAIERLQKRLRKTCCCVRTLGDIRVTAGANSWFAFLCSAVNLLRDKGSLCFLLPAAFEYANYASGLRLKMGSHFESVAVYRSNKPLFHNVQDGSIILVAHGFRLCADLEARESISRSIFTRAEELIVPIKPLHALTASVNDRVCKPWVIVAPESRPAQEFFKIGIGAVTGDANFFLMNEEQRQEFELPTWAFRPVLTRARHLTSYLITSAIWKSLRAKNERVWLFYPFGSAMDHPAVMKYIRWGKLMGCNVNNHKIAIRSPWFRVVVPEEFDGFISGMSTKGPYIALRRMKALTATNTLYGVKFIRTAAFEARCAVSLALLTSRTQEQLSKIQRRYADGLIKYELGDLRELRLLVPQRAQGASNVYRRAVRAVLAQKLTEACDIADDWFSTKADKSA